MYELKGGKRGKKKGLYISNGHSPNKTHQTHIEIVNCVSVL